jgi:hypothetical protein
MWHMHRRIRKEETMLTWTMTILMTAALAGALFATDAQARGGGGGRVRNFGPSSASIGLANPGARDLARPTDPNQVFSLPGFVAPSQAFPLGASQTFAR